jgi:glutamyl-tRNA synthetase
MNGHYIRQLKPDQLLAKAKDFWPPEAEKYDNTYKKQVLGLVQERLKYFAELPELTEFFFKDLPVDPKLWTEHKQLKKIDPKDLRILLINAKAELEKSTFKADDLTERLNDLLSALDQKPAVLFSLIRIATTQAPASPSLAETLAVLGKDVSLHRLNTMLAVL